MDAKKLIFQTSGNILVCKQSKIYWSKDEMEETERSLKAEALARARTKWMEAEEALQMQNLVQSTPSINGEKRSHPQERTLLGTVD